MTLFKNISFISLKKGLNKTRERLVNGILETFSGKAQVDIKDIDEIEEILLSCDIGSQLATKIIENARKEFLKETDRTKDNLLRIIKGELKQILLDGSFNKSEFFSYNKSPFVILIVGVNGAGKTTTIAKLADNIRKSDKSVLIASADTFRAAANEQLETWAERAGVEIIKRQSGSDPASVVYDSLNIAKSKHYDVLLIDTAGRLHTKTNLMKELSKINNVISKIIPDAPHETLLTIDGNTGQNAITQAEEFNKSVSLTGLIITKLDGTAKGGVIFQICASLKIPIKFIGIGERIDDLQNFDSNLFIDALF